MRGEDQYGLFLKQGIDRSDIRIQGRDELLPIFHKTRIAPGGISVIRSETIIGGAI